MITAGSAQKPGEKRLDLLKRNAEIVVGITEEVALKKSRGVMLIVSNPVDVLTWVGGCVGWKHELGAYCLSKVVG